MTTNQDADLIRALQAYQQADADGVMVLVSRQACDEAAARLSELTQPAPHKIPIPPAPADALDVVYAEGWNACVDQFFSGKPMPEVTITVEQPAPLPLSPDLAPLWAGRVNRARCSFAPTGVDEAILAVDALLRRRVTDEWIEERFTTYTLNAETVNAFFRGEA